MITESAPLTLQGSFARSLTLSKLWLCRELNQLMRPQGIARFNKVYSLGSWYGNMALFMLRKHVPFRVLIDVDLDANYLRTSQRLLPRLYHSGRLISLACDCNRLVYDLQPPSLVINCSTNNMRNAGWLDHIPTGTWVALQGRNHEPDNRFNTLRRFGEFDAEYPLAETLFAGTISLADPDDAYDRWMKIGIK
jgi:hypothetical protein